MATNNDYYNQLLEEGRAKYGPSANPYASAEPSNTGPYAPGSGDPTRDPWEQAQGGGGAQWSGPQSDKMNQLGRQIQMLNERSTALDRGKVSKRGGKIYQTPARELAAKEKVLADQRAGLGAQQDAIVASIPKAPPVAPAGNYYAGLGGGGGGGGTGTQSGSYTLPGAAEASQALRDLQMGGARGLQGLMNRDTTAQRAAMEQALFKGQKQAINTAAERARAAMLEGTFGRGVGPSSITVELAGRGQQEQSDALARARREAFTQAGAEDRAEMAALLGLNQAAFGAGTTGLQGEANVALANLARELQASQFDRNLQFQGGENALNRAQAASQFGQNLGLQQQQLGQQASQFGQGLAFQGGQNALNREQQTALAQMGYDFTGGQNQLSRDFTGAQNQLSRDQQTALTQMGFDFTGGQNQLSRDQQTALAQMGYDFTGGQNQATRDLNKYLADTGQTFTGQQNQLTREQSMQQLLLQLANQRDIASGNRTTGAIGAAGAGITGLLNPVLAQLAKQWGEG